MKKVTYLCDCVLGVTIARNRIAAPKPEHWATAQFYCHSCGTGSALGGKPRSGQGE